MKIPTALLLLILASVAAEEVPVLKTWEGKASGILKPECVRVGDEAAWKSLWARHAPGVPVPEADFSKQMAVGIFVGDKAFNGVTIREVRRTEDGFRIVVILHEDEAPASAYTPHFRILLLPKDPGRVTILRRVAECGGIVAKRDSEVALLAFETLAKRQMGPFKKAERRVISDPKEWDALRGDLPAVDSGKEAVILVAIGERPNGGYAIEITRIEAQGDDLVVHVKESVPDPGMISIQVLTQPFHAVRVPRPKGTLRFVAD